MIERGTVILIQRIALHNLRVYEHQARYPERVTHYIDLMTENPTADPGLVMVKPIQYGFEILDGHHRYCAAILTGRADLLCAVILE